MGNLHLRFDEGRGARSVPSYSTMEKREVRELARQFDLPVASKGDSQEICFVPNGDYAAFIDAYFREKGIATPEMRGEIVAGDGRKLGEHAGVHHFTVGQRRGLGIAAGEPLYVISTDARTRQVVVGPGDRLLRDSLWARDVNWIAVERLAEPVRGEVKIRNKHRAAPATILPHADPSRAEVRFDEPQRAVTPGQAALFYQGDLVLGGGWIE